MKRSPRRCGFTLIELLVVISIIAMLISILLPALGAAREAARASGCLSNQRQIGISLTAYAEDSEGRYPSFALPSSPNFFWWQRMHAAKYFTVTNDFQSVVMCPSGIDQRAPGNEWHNAVSNDPEIDSTNAMYIDPTWGSKFQIANYGINTYSNSGPANNETWNNKCWPVGFNHDEGRVGLRNYHIKHASELLLAFDGLGTNPNNGGKWSLRHNGKTANVLFVDGHATAMAQNLVPNWYYDDWGKEILVNEDPARPLGFRINDVKHSVW